MKLSRTTQLILAGLIVVAVIVVGFALPRSTQGDRNALPLSRPPFLDVAHAQEGQDAVLDIGAKLDAEAGISAYYKSTVPIDLNTAKTAFRTIEIQTSDYIVGSVAITGYLEHYDAHVYVHKDGWMLAYYLRPDPVGKILDVKAQSINSTKLKSALAAVAGAAGAPFTTESYYDFRYPNATHMLLVSEDEANGNDFNIQLPSSYGYYERSWGLTGEGSYGYSYFKLNGADLTPSFWGDFTGYGVITAGQMVSDVQHHIMINNRYGVLALVYSVP
jgi:hypothetical protein